MGLFIVHGLTRCPCRGWYAERTTRVYTTRVYTSLSVITTGKVWGDKRGKDKAWELDAHAKNLSRAQCLFRVPCMVLRALCCLPVYPPFLRSGKQTHNPFSPTHTDKLTRAVPKGQTEAHTQQQQAGREASWLKEVRKQEGEG